MTAGRIFEKAFMWALLAILICVASSALIRWVVFPENPSTALAEKQASFNTAQNSKFQSLFDQGTTALNDGRYTDALSHWQEAERSVPQLSDDQYAALKKARLQLASTYEAAGEGSAAEGVYKMLADSALRDGNAYFHSREEIALGRYQDAGDFAEHLTDQHERYFLMANHAEVACLRDLRRFPEAAVVTQKAIDYFANGRDDYDSRIVDQYRELAQTYLLAEDWEHLEQTIHTAVSLDDKIVSHFAGARASNDPTATLLFTKDQMLYALMDVYDREGKPDEALSTADDIFTFVSQHSQYAELGPHSRREVADFAYRIATKANREDAATTWRERAKIWR